MRTLMSLVVVALVIPAPLGAMQAPPAQGKPAAPAQTPAAKPAAPAAAPASPSTPAPAAAKPAAAASAQAKPAPAAQPAKPNAQGQPAAAPVEAAAPPPPPPPAASASDTYTYEPSDRRDPFLNLLDRGLRPGPITRLPGLAGLSVNEISVRGVIEKLDGGYVAMVQGPDNKTYSIHPGDRLADGLVRAVNAEGLVIVQEVNDPLSLVKQREVSKKLRSLEAKE
jgi:type IV pilus assembly protein PilP